MKAMRRDEKGFTLIELLIVIIILGILAVIGIPKFMNSKAVAIVKACQTNRSSLEDAGERFFFDTGKYPGTGASSDAGTVQGTYLSATACASVNGWNGPYIKADFVCPLDGDKKYWFNPSSGTVTCDNSTGTAVAAKDLSDTSKVASGKHANSIDE
jgi:prepilin-type N-terminal cleavage/methylation domain-containing protein